MEQWLAAHSIDMHTAQMFGNEVEDILTTRTCGIAADEAATNN